MQRELDTLQNEIVDEFLALTEVQGVESAIQFLMDCLLCCVCLVLFTVW